jgi:hypothetical protein
MGGMNLSARKMYLSCRAGTIRGLGRLLFFLALSACLKRLVGGGEGVILALGLMCLVMRINLWARTGMC